MGRGVKSKKPKNTIVVAKITKYVHLCSENHPIHALLSQKYPNTLCLENHIILGFVSPFYDFSLSQNSCFFFKLWLPLTVNLLVPILTIQICPTPLIQSLIMALVASFGSYY